MLGLGGCREQWEEGKGRSLLSSLFPPTGIPRMLLFFPLRARPVAKTPLWSKQHERGLWPWGAERLCEKTETAGHAKLRNKENVRPAKLDENFGRPMGFEGSFAHPYSHVCCIC